MRLPAPRRPVPLHLPRIRTARGRRAMSDPRIRLLFSRRELIAMQRCPDCGWHPKTQFHHPDCPNRETED
ncbi:hypothetical protein HWB60_gp074 [Mycobacterium phage TChen]|uniref:Uncharacterized protein n=2 Tax=Gracegardnervirinae TaxID=2946632 RepID=A0A2S1PD22_9CAUD|nr:hypothetical protein HWB60_gp074 [Mycobacterium phage TChen]AWH14470.1 hypothetical protein SEA_TCHEN_74 [Mycobacterium phage TChen]